MRVPLVLVLVSISAAMSCQTPAENSVKSCGYELLTCGFNTLSSTAEKLLESVQKNETNVEEKLNKILERMTKMETGMKSLEEQMNVMKMDLSTASDNIEKNTSDQLKKIIEQNIDRISNQITKLELNGTQNLKSLEEQKKAIDELTKNIKQHNSRIVELEAKLDTKTEAPKMNETAPSENTTVIGNRTVISDCGTCNKSGVYQLEKLAKTVYCEIDSTIGGGWLVIQQRVDRNLSFEQTWQEYRDGFGVVAKNESFWLGNEAVHQITKEGNYELAIELREGNRPTKEVRYSQFRLAGEDEKYRLIVGGHSGSLGDNLSKHNNMKFTTYDNDNDLWSGVNCASLSGSGWWYDSCSLCNLNYYRGPHWSGASDANIGFADFSRMMIRRK